MVRLSRKQREIREREELILDIARNLILDRGYLALTMDRIAQEAEYSKGTIYQHFSCKEEVLMALTIKTWELHCQLFERAAMFKGRPRERMIAVGMAEELFVRLYTEEFKCALIIKTAPIREKTSNTRQQHLRGCEHRCMSIVSGIVRDAIAQGDIALDASSPPIKPEDICFALWSLNFGAHSLIFTDIPLAELGILDPYAMVYRNSHALMDGFHWKPLLADWDYEATKQRIQEEVFQDEFKQLSARA